MKFLDKLKSIFKKEKVKALESGKEQKDFEITVTSPNGVNITMNMAKDQNGNPIYDNVYDMDLGIVKQIPKYKILKIMKDGNFRCQDILFDINTEQLQNPEVIEFIKNNVLNESTLNNIENNYNYVGKLVQDENHQFSTEYDIGIYRSLKERYYANLRSAEFQRYSRSQEEQETIRRNAQNYEVHIESSPEGFLQSNQDYKEPYR